MRVFRNPSVSRPRLTGDVFQTWPGKAWLEKPGPWCRTKYRLGRRGAMLLLLGCLYLLLGYREQTMIAPPVAGAWFFLVPTWIRTSLWMVTGALAVWFSTRRKHEQFHTGPRRFDRLRTVWSTDAFGWFALYVVPVLTITSYGGSFGMWILYDKLLPAVPPLPLHGDPTAWTNAVLRFSFVIVVLICSGWKENPPRSDCA